MCHPVLKFKPKFKAGLIRIPPGAQPFFRLWVDDIAVAVSNMSPNLGGDYTMALNTIVRVESGQRISLSWTNDGGCEIAGNDEEFFTHWTGEYLGSGARLYPLL